MINRKILISEFDVISLQDWVSWRSEAAHSQYPRRRIIVGDSHEAISVSIDVVDDFEYLWWMILNICGGRKIMNKRLFRNGESHRIFDVWILMLTVY